MRKPRRMRRLFNLALLGLLGGTALSLLPRDSGLEEFGWPWVAVDRYPNKFLGNLTKKDAENIIETFWSHGEFAPSLKYGGRFYVRIAYGRVIAFRPLAILGHALLFAVVYWMLRATINARFLRKSLEGRQPRCQNCGYNLTGNTSGVCPECGSPTAESNTPPSPT